MNSNITIAGEGYISEGTYNKINIMGSANSNGDIKSESLKINGEAQFKGNIDSRIFKVNGDCDVVGNVDSNKIVVNGDARISGYCKVESLKVNGDLNICGTLECNNVTIRGDLKVLNSIYACNLKVYGDLKVNVNIEADDVKIYGQVNCDGLLTGEDIYIYPKGMSKCKEIGATTIIVDKDNKKDIFKKIFSWGMGSLGRLNCEIIEGDNIKLRNTKVGKLNGNNITLISKCNVDNIEYTENLDVSIDSNVNNQVKIG